MMETWEVAAKRASVQICRGKQLLGMKREGVFDRLPMPDGERGLGETGAATGGAGGFLRSAPHNLERLAGPGSSRYCLRQQYTTGWYCISSLGLLNSRVLERELFP